MFTGLVVERGRLSRDPWPSEQGGQRLELTCSRELAQRLDIGASLAVAGVCLTVVELSTDGCQVELSPETLSRTTLGALAGGDRVNLEPALQMGEPLGGHWVQGHVDTVTEVVGRKELDEHRELAFAIPDGLESSFVEKGSVTIDGVSLTVASLRRISSSRSTVEDELFTVALIPHTLEVTTLRHLSSGDLVNLEVDVLAKYVARSLGGALDELTERVTSAVLRRLERS